LGTFIYMYWQLCLRMVTKYKRKGKLFLNKIDSNNN
jgi:hypothetical protein